MPDGIAIPGRRAGLFLVGDVYTISQFRVTIDESRDFASNSPMGYVG
jgi:hypothetical protein